MYEPAGNPPDMISVPIPTPGDPLAERRRSAAIEVLWDQMPAIRALHQRDTCDQAAFLDGLEDLTDRLWAYYLVRLKDECREKLPEVLLSRLDEQVRSGPAEFMDRESYPMTLRELEVFQLHCFNLLTGAYRAVTSVLDEMIRSSQDSWKGEGILDLASGYGGFPAFLSSRYPDLMVTGSDIQPGYVERANRRAVGRRNLSYRVVNALNMEREASQSCLAVSILQAVHHFRPGQLARMIHEGARIGRRGIVIADAVRSPYLPPVLAAGTLLLTWNPFFVVDAVWSGFRMYHSVELELIARIALPDAEPVTRLVAPAFNVLQVEDGRVAEPRRDIPVKPRY